MTIPYPLTEQDSQGRTVYLYSLEYTGPHGRTCSFHLYALDELDARQHAKCIRASLREPWRVLTVTPAGQECDKLFGYAAAMQAVAQ
jgi:hypothetical protein